MSTKKRLKVFSMRQKLSFLIIISINTINKVQAGLSRQQEIPTPKTEMGKKTN